MRAWLDRVWDRQVGLDDYLPGTSHKSRNIPDAFPYHILGRSTLPSKEEDTNSTEAERKFREQDAVRRRQFPSCFEEACAYGNLQAAILLWSQGTVDIKTRKAVYEGNNASALMWASFKGHLPIVRFLVDHEAPLDATNSLGHTALQWAITAGHTDVARYLLDHGADPAHRDRQGFDAAFSAVQNDRLALLLMLTEDASKEGHLLQTSDHGLVFYQPSPEQRAMASTKINPRTQKPYYLLDPTMRDVEGHTLMHWAAYRNSPATCQYLIDHWGYAVDAQDKHGRTPLVWAAREGFAEVMEVLLARGADRNCADSDGWTALQYARTRNHPEAVYVLEAYPRGLTNGGVGGVGGDDETGTRGGLANPVSSTSNGAGAKNGMFREDEADGETVVNVAESARAALLGGAQHSNNNTNNTNSSGRYVCVRDRRAYGTLQMIRTHPIFAVMAASGVLYLIATYILMNLLPPVVSYFPFGIYFFKNVAWTSLTPRPTQSSRTGPPPSVTKMMGIAATIAESVRGTWLFRVRDPANLCIWLAFLFLQVAAWNRLGLPQLFASNDPAENANVNPAGMWPKHLATSATNPHAVPLHPTPLVHFFGLSLIRFFSFYRNPFNELGGVGAYELPEKTTTAQQWATLSAAAEAYTAQSQNLVRWTLMLLFLATLVCAVLCKLTASRSALKPSEEGTLRTSPLWRIVAARQYRWLHPRFFFQERHLQFPLRAFYCPERDVVVRGYDGYSNLLDCPIGESNHLFFVLTLTFFAVYQFLLMVWGLQQMRSLLQCPAQVPWYQDAFFAFRSTEALESGMKTRAVRMAAVAAAAASTTTTTLAPLDGETTAAAATAVEDATMTALSSAVLAMAAPVISFAWLNTGMDALLHGLPCRQYQRLDEITQDYLHAVAASKADGAAPSSFTQYVRRILFLIQYYCWPTRASALGVWVLHYSFLAAFSIGCVAVRQWIGVWHGATRLELANPLAQGADGELVSIFPREPQQAQRVVPIDRDEERYYAEVCVEKARSVDGALPQDGSRCIYAEGNGFVNVVMFLVGRLGKRWRGAMAVSSHNAPVKTPLLM